MRAIVAILVAIAGLSFAAMIPIYYVADNMGLPACPRGSECKHVLHASMETWYLLNKVKEIVTIPCSASILLLVVIGSATGWLSTPAKPTCKCCGSQHIENR